MMPASPCRTFAVLALVLVSAPLPLYADEEAAGDEGENAEPNRRPCGKLAGKPVFLNIRTEYSYGTRHSASETSECSIELMTLDPEESGPDTSYETLLSWTEEFVGNAGEIETDRFAEACKTDRHTLTLLSGDSVSAVFAYRQGGLVLAPGFRKKLLAGMERNASIRTAALQTGLSGLDDPRIHEALRAYAIMDSIEQGYVDYALEALADHRQAAKDKQVLAYCKRLSDSLIAWKKSEQPVFLVESRKAGKIINAPVYPPNDSPTVFWKDSLLCVVQEDKAKPASMRTFDPRTGKWGPNAKLIYPESGMYQLYRKETGTWSMACNYENFCWTKNMGPITEDPCDGISCSPLILLDDSAGGSVRSRQDLARAGGSCAAGDGTLEFNFRGRVRRMDSSKVSWKVVEGDFTYESESDDEWIRHYPVVVSPNQGWVAYALKARGGEGIELWVAKLKYKP